MKKLLYVFITAIAFTLLLFNLLSIYHIPFMGMQIFRVSSGSMEPTIKVNNLIVSKKQDEYHEGDIVTYKKDKEYITHRIVNISGDEVTTRGDANNTNDKPFSKSDIVGKYVYRFKITAIFNFIFRNPLNVFFTFALYVAISLIIKTIRE